MNVVTPIRYIYVIGVTTVNHRKPVNVVTTFTGFYESSYLGVCLTEAV